MVDIFGNIDENDPLLDEGPDAVPDNLMDGDTIKVTPMKPDNKNQALFEKAAELRAQERMNLTANGHQPAVTLPVTQPENFNLVEALSSLSFAIPGAHGASATAENNADPVAAFNEHMEGLAEGEEQDTDSARPEEEPEDQSVEDGIDPIEEARRRLEEEEEERKRLEEENRARQHQGPGVEAITALVNGTAKLVGGTMALGGAALGLGASAVEGAAGLGGKALAFASEAFKALSGAIVKGYDAMSLQVVEAANWIRHGKSQDDEFNQINNWAPANEALFDPTEGAFNKSDLDSDPITPTAITNATQDMGVGDISEKIKAFQASREAPIIEANQMARNKLTDNISENLGQVESALKLNEVGQLPLMSKEDFENRLKTSTQEDQDKVHQALNNILGAGEQYQKDARRFIQGDGKSVAMDALNPEVAENEIRAFDKKAADPTEDLDEHQKKLMSMLGLDGQSLGEKLGDMLSGLRDMMQGAMGRLGALGASRIDAAANTPDIYQEQRLG